MITFGELLLDPKLPVRQTLHLGDHPLQNSRQSQRIHRGHLNKFLGEGHLNRLVLRRRGGTVQHEAENAQEAAAVACRAACAACGAVGSRVGPR